MICVLCGFDNSESSQFCLECGQTLRLVCPHCAHRLPSSANFCNKCGNSVLTGVSAMKPLKVIAGERKYATILFSDLSGYTAITEKHDPELVKMIMGRIFSETGRIVEKYEGTIERFFGDEIMVLFGIPQSHEDDPIRAIHAAFEIHKTIGNLRLEAENRINSPLNMHTGINTGLTVTGDEYIGKGRHGLTGDAVNLAKRLNKLAQPGEILVGPETYHHSKAFINFKKLKPIKLKGKSIPVKVFKALDLSEHVRKYIYKPRLGIERKIYSEMVGRDLELETLVQQVEKVTTGTGAVVNIIGEAGIGKSRLLDELKKREETNQVSLYEGRSIAMGRKQYFHPIVDLLRHWARIRDSEDENTAFEKLEVALREVLENNTHRILPFIAKIMGIPLSEEHAIRVKDIEGEALEKLVLKSFRDLLIKASDMTPLVIIMEDIHWADLSSITLLLSLYRLVETKRILFINIFRPGHKETGDKIVETIDKRLSVDCIQIRLKPLDNQSSEALINNMLNIQGLHHDIKYQIVQRTGGNPFFIEEVVRSLIEEEAIVSKNNRFEVTNKINNTIIPHSINDVIMTRIDRLEEYPRYILKVASVIGRSFPYPILVEILGNGNDIDEHLEKLQNVHLIKEHKKIDGKEYFFNHALAQESVYNSILMQERKELHQKAATSIEKIFNKRINDFYSMLAYHYSMTENTRKTEEYLIKAGKEAVNASASQEAMHYYKEALKLFLNKYHDSIDKNQIAEIEKNIALALYNKGQYDESIKYFDNALDTYWKKLPQNKIAVIFHSFMAFFHILIELHLPQIKRKKVPTKKDILNLNLLHKKCRALSIIDPMQLFIASLYTCRETTRFELSKFSLGYFIFIGLSGLFSFSGISFRMSRKILNYSGERLFADDIKISILYDLLSTIEKYLSGNWTTINPFNGNLVNSAINLGEIHDASQYLYWHAFPKIYQGSTETVESIINSLNDMADTFDHALSRSFQYEVRINYLLEYRVLDEALKETEKGEELAKSLNVDYDLLDIYSCRILIHLLMGDFNQAELFYQKAKRISQEVDSPVPMQLSNFYRSQLKYFLYRLNESIVENDTSAIKNFSKKARKSAKLLLKTAKKAAKHRPEAYRLTGLYCWLINKKKSALKWWSESIIVGEQLGARLELSRTYFEIGKQLKKSENRHITLNGLDGEEYLRKAEAIFKALELSWDLHQLSQLSDKQTTQDIK
jgi:class 3 adenylate cyclase/tetratricopeptide (TPR) repeat protein